VLIKTDVLGGPHQLSGGGAHSRLAPARHDARVSRGFSATAQPLVSDNAATFRLLKCVCHLNDRRCQS